MRLILSAVVCGLCFVGAANACDVQQVVAAPIVAQAVSYPQAVVLQQQVYQPAVVQQVVARPVIQRVKVQQVRAVRAARVQKIKTKTVIR